MRSLRSRCGNGYVMARHPTVCVPLPTAALPAVALPQGRRCDNREPPRNAAMGRTGMPIVLRRPPIVLRRPPMVLRRPPIIMGRNRRNRRKKRTCHTNPVGLKVRRCILSSPSYFQSTPWVAHNGKKRPRLHDGSHGRFCYYWNWCQGRGRYQLSVFRKKL